MEITRGASDSEAHESYCPGPHEVKNLMKNPHEITDHKLRFQDEAWTHLMSEMTTSTNA